MMKKRNKILVVDDAEINRFMLTDILCEEYEIIEADSGIEAVNVIGRRFSFKNNLDNYRRAMLSFL